MLLALGAPTAAPVASAEPAPPLLQFTAGGHVIGFAPTQVVLASLDHALRIEFVGTAGVTPVAAGADAPASGDGLTMGRAQPLGVVTYREHWLRDCRGWERQRLHHGRQSRHLAGG